MFNRWDLDGIDINRDILIKKGDSNYNMAVLFYYIIGNLFYNTELYTRQGLLGNEFYFTTNEELYLLTGIYAISFEEGRSSEIYTQFFNSYSKLDIFNTSFDIRNLANIIIYGNLDILNYYGFACDMKHRMFEPIHLRILEEECGASHSPKLIEGSSSFDLNMGLWISDLVECSNKDLIYLSSSKISLSVYFDLLSHRIQKSLQNINKSVDKDFIINSYPLNKLNCFPFEFCNYFKSVTITFLGRELNSFDRNIEKYSSLSSFVSKLNELNLTNFKFGFRNELGFGKSNYVLTERLDNLLGPYLNESFNGRRFGEIENTLKNLKI